MTEADEIIAGRIIAGDIDVATATRVILQGVELSNKL